MSDTATLDPPAKAGRSRAGTFVNSVRAALGITGPTTIPTDRAGLDRAEAEAKAALADLAAQREAVTRDANAAFVDGGTGVYDYGSQDTFDETIADIEKRATRLRSVLEDIGIRRARLAAAEATADHAGNLTAIAEAFETMKAATRRADALLVELVGELHTVRRTGFAVHGRLCERDSASPAWSTVGGQKTFDALMARFNSLLYPKENGIAPPLVGPRFAADADAMMDLQRKAVASRAAGAG